MSCQVDAKHVELHLDEQKPEGVVNEALEQIAYADRVVLNKTDLVCAHAGTRCVCGGMQRVGQRTGGALEKKSGIAGGGWEMGGCGGRDMERRDLEDQSVHTTFSA
jgi:hypothetical protein